jgi:NADH dehydrogenase/NADH:ubiquinone oxidoreductase subunit G
MVALLLKKNTRYNSGFDMSDSIRIKQFLKKGIQAEILSVDQLLQLRAEHLAGVAELQDIDEAILSETLQQIQSKMRSRPQKKSTVQPKQQQPQQKTPEDNIMQLIEKRAGLHLAAVKEIFSH